jgi:hypothetical protein
MNRWPDKDPQDDVIYSLDLADAIDAGDALESATWDAPSSLALTPLDPVGDVARVRIAAGNAGETYVVTCTATTENGFTIQRALMLKVRES